jgi:hypothetical protein
MMLRGGKLCTGRQGAGDRSCSSILCVHPFCTMTGRLSNGDPALTGNNSRSHLLHQVHASNARHIGPLVVFIILVQPLRACGDVPVAPLPNSTPRASSSSGLTSEAITSAAVSTTQRRRYCHLDPTSVGSTTPTATATMTPTAASKTDSPTTGQPAVPKDLAGMWNGGPDPGEFWLTLTSDARY